MIYKVNINTEVYIDAPNEEKAKERALGIKLNSLHSGVKGFVTGVESIAYAGKDSFYFCPYEDICKNYAPCICDETCCFSPKVVK